MNMQHDAQETDGSGLAVAGGVEEEAGMKEDGGCAAASAAAAVVDVGGGVSPATGRAGVTARHQSRQETASLPQQSRPGTAALPASGRLVAAPTADAMGETIGKRKGPAKVGGIRAAKASGNGEARAGAAADNADGSGGANVAGPVVEASLVWALIAAEGESTQVARDARLRLSEARALLSDTAQVQRIRRLRAAGTAIAQGELALMARAVFAELLLNARGGSDLAALIRVFDKLPGAAEADSSSDEALLDEISGLSLDEAVQRARRLLSEIDAAEAVQ